MTTSAAPVRSRLHRPDLRVEKHLLRDGCRRLAAMDEVGRGALAGPVTVGVVVVTAAIGRVPAGLRDSKLLTPAARERLVGPVRRWAVDWAIGHAWPDEIDEHGIIGGLRLAARRALGALAAPVDAVLLDGNHDYLNASGQPALFGAEREPGPGSGTAVGTLRGPLRGTSGRAAPVGEDRGFTGYVPVHLQIKADLRCAAVAAASVLAKTTRDAMMVDYAAISPEYGWAVNKGYATREHLAAIADHGPSERHRLSWRLSGPVADGPVGEDGSSGSDPAADGRRDRVRVVGTAPAGPRRVGTEWKGA